MTSVTQDASETIDRAPSFAWRRAMRPLRPLLSQVLAISLFINILALVVPIFVLQVYDRVIAHAGITTLQGLVAGVGAALAFDFLLRQLRSRVLQRVSLGIDAHLSGAVIRKILALPLRTLEQRSAAFWQATLRDAEVVRNTIGGAVAVLFCDLPFALLFLGLIFVIATPVAWVLVIALPVFILVAWWSGVSIRRAGAREQSAIAARNTLVGEIVARRDTVKALGLSTALLPLWDARQAEGMREGVERGRSADRFANFTVGLVAFTTVALTTVGALAIIDQQLTIGALVAANMLAGRVTAPFNQLVGSWRGITGFRQSVTRLKEVLSLPEDRQAAPVEHPRPEGRITLDHVTFAYAPTAKPVFDQLSLSLAGPGMHAIVGRNGSGKSTLLKLIHGLYAPLGGRVAIDGADLAQFGRDDLNRWIGYLPQECVLMQGTIRQNLVGGRPDVGDEALLRASAQAGVHAAIVDLPDGYAAEVGEGGGRLSGGQRQRIALARALVGDPPILLLDEPTSSLDRRAEEDLRGVLEGLARERTILVVTHSALLLGACRTVTVIDRGAVAAHGSPREVLPQFFASPTVPAVAPLGRTA